MMPEVMIKAKGTACMSEANTAVRYNLVRNIGKKYFAVVISFFFSLKCS